jgi:hypothetical protein
MPWKDQNQRKAYERRYYRANRDKYRARHRHNKYRLSLAKIDAMAKAQNFECAVCDTPGDDLGVDHCHSTRRVWALLCRSCNVALGYAKEDVARLKALADYAEWQHEISDLIGPLP